MNQINYKDSLIKLIDDYENIHRMNGKVWEYLYKFICRKLGVTL